LRYFPFIKSAIKNDNAANFDVKSDKKYTAAFNRGLRAYNTHLDKIAERLGPRAYRFFRYGFAETGLHDGFLVGFTFGDGIGLREEQLERLRFGRGPSIGQLQILSYAHDALHTFVFKKPRTVTVDIPSADPLFFGEGTTLGQIYSYEVVAVSPRYLRNEWLLDSGGTITVEFEKLYYRRQKLKIKNAVNRRPG
jgi:hypothetical protein